MSLKDTIIGNAKIADGLEKNYQTDKLAHAYLFEGSKHLGKKTLALHFCELLLNSKEKNISKNPDLLIINPSEDDKQITVEEIRNLEKVLGLYPYCSKYKIAVIEQAERMNKAAANALLKTLEEPNKTTILILLSSNTNLLPKTIKSRCRRLKFLPVRKKILEAFLKDKTSDKTEAENIMEISGYRPGKIIQFLDDKESVNQAMKRIDQFSAIIQKNENERINEAENITSGETKEIISILDLWTIYCRKILVKGYENYSENKRESLSRTVQRINLITKTKEDILSKNINIKLAVENLLLQM